MKKGDNISIYWSDIKKYYGNEETKPTPMYTEGFFEMKKKNFIIIKNPETLNMEKLENHPTKKPKFYAIPLGLIKEIQKIK